MDSEFSNSVVTVVDDKLVVLDGRVDDEKLAELLALQNERPALDFKELIDLTNKPGLIELAKDVGAFQVAGGYIIGGVDGHGVPNGTMNGCDTRLFDEANLAPKLRQYLPESTTVHSRVTKWKGHTVVIIYVAPNPDGCAVFKAVGQYPKPAGGKNEMNVVFREGEIFWRNGTRSERISQQGLREIIDRQVAREKETWISEQHELRRHEREAIEAAYAGRELAKAPLGTVTLSLTNDELRIAVLELIRAADQVALTHLLNDARARAADAINRDQIESELGELLDKLGVVAVVCLEYEQPEIFDRVVNVFAQIYSLPLGPHDDRRFSLSTAIDPREKAPRVFLEVLERVYALGGVGVRLKKWEAIRELTLQTPDRIDDYWKNWLRHGQVMAARAQQFVAKNESGQETEISLLTLAAKVVESESGLHPDTDDKDAILTSLAQFDLLSNLIAIDAAASVESSVFYTSWARFRQERIQPIADRIATDSEFRKAIFGGSDTNLALALLAVGKMARTEGIRYDGFWGWDTGTPIGNFIQENAPSDVNASAP
jgi:hypothetical protein